MKHKRHLLNAPLLIASIALPLIVGVIGALFTAPEIPTWYASLEKPFFNPPNWIFGPVWTLLYIAQGIAFYLVVSSKSKRVSRAVVLFLVQLVLNLLWSIVFFGLHQPILALYEIMLLWLTLIVTCYEFFKHSKVAGQLMIPYIAWVSFAMALTAGVVYLN